MAKQAPPHLYFLDKHGDWLWDGPGFVDGEWWTVDAVIAKVREFLGE